jgi:Ca-activated chloride channel family protein
MNKPVCPRCNAIAQTDNAQFCGKCGYRFPAAEPQPASTPPAPVTPTTTTTSTTPAIGNQAPPFSPLSWLRLRVSKPILFGLNGALGCLLGALLGEFVLAFLLPPPPPPPPAVDLMFAVDRTSSMTKEIEGVKDGIGQFAEEFNRRGLQSRTGLLAFGDRLSRSRSEPHILSFNGERFTGDSEAFRAEVSRIEQVGGGDLPESSYDALAEAARQPFRPDAKKIIVLITDAPPQLPDKETQDPATIFQLFKERGIDQFHIVTKTEFMEFFTPLQSAAPGQTFVLEEDGRSGFDQILVGIGSRIAESIRSVSGNRQFSAEQFRQVLLVTALWTALLAMGIALWLIVGQKLYLRQPLSWNRFDKQIMFGALGGLLAGFMAGSAGQWLFTGAGQSETVRVISWTILGACIGWGLSYFVPNLARVKAALGGALGGFVGVLAFLLLSNSMADWLGRLCGAVILGFCIGLMLALIELVTRRAWIEVARGGNETWIVNLGEAPVRVGSREISEIYIRDTEPDVYRFRLEKGQVHRETIATGQSFEMRNGETLTVGETVLTLRTQTDS